MQANPSLVGLDPLDDLSAETVFSGQSDGSWLIESQLASAIEERVQLCMIQEGFRDYSPQYVVERPPADVTGISTREWARSHGYGLVDEFRRFFSSASFGPNIQLLDQLTPAERDAYNAAVGRVGPDGPSGCRGDAWSEVRSEPLWIRLAEFQADQSSALRSFTDEVDFVSAQVEWSRCMAEKGFRYPNQFAAYNDFEVRIQDFQTAVLTQYLEFPEEVSLSASLAAQGDLGELPWFDDHELDDLLDEEILVATADHDCYNLHVRTVVEPVITAAREDLFRQYEQDLTNLIDQATSQ